MNEEKNSLIFYGGIKEGDFLPKVDYYKNNPYKALGNEKIYIANEINKVCISQITKEIKNNFLNLHGPLTRNNTNEYNQLIKVYACEIDNFLKFPVEGYEFRRFLLDEDNDYIYFWTYHLAGYVEKRSWNTDIYFCRQQINKASFILNDFILSYFAWWSIFQGGFIIHAASVLKDGKAYLFFGPPEIGKTTICRLSISLGLNIISDEYSMLLNVNNNYKVFRPPQKKSITHLDDWQKGYPIAGIYKLVQANEHFIEDIPKPIIISEILANLLFAHGYNVLGKYAIENSINIINKVDYARLHFKKDKYFWEVIEKNVNFKKNTN